MPDVRLCVLCRQRPLEPRFAPFCSRRCQMADLGRWLSGEYRVSGRALGDPDTDDLVTAEDDRDEQHG